MMKCPACGKLTKADIDNKTIFKCGRCNGKGKCCRGCAGFGLDHPELRGACGTDVKCPDCDGSGVISKEYILSISPYMRRRFYSDLLENINKPLGIDSNDNDILEDPYYEIKTNLSKKLFVDKKIISDDDIRKLPDEVIWSTALMFHSRHNDCNINDDYENDMRRKFEAERKKRNIKDEILGDTETTYTED